MTALRFKKRIPLLCLFLALLLFPAGCAKAWRYDPITDVNDLGGRRVGVMLSWEADYLLTGRQDMEIFRYDAVSDMILALKYDKVDVIAVDEPMWQIMSTLSDGLEKAEEPFATCGYIAYFSTEGRDLAEDFDRFLADFKETEDYRDLLARLDTFDGLDYAGPEIPLTGTGETLRVAYAADGFPHAYLDAGMDVPTGYDMEVLKRYANDRGWRLSFIPSFYTDGMMGLQSGMYDMCIGYLGDVYAEEVVAAGFYVSGSMFDLPQVFVQKTQPDFSIRLEEME